MWRNILLLLILCTPDTHAQKKAWETSGYLNFGCQVFIHDIFKSHGFPGARMYVAVSLSGTRRGVILNYGPSVSVYTRTIGANLNTMVGDIQVDFTNTFTAGVVWGDNMGYAKLARTLHNGDYYNLSINRKNSVLLSSNFILNNHKRNQVVGAINFDFGNFGFYYYNDGGPGIDHLSTGDKFDRYWTGGGGIFVHSNRGYNVLELGFDQFTGYRPLLYELSNILGIKVPLYDQPLANRKASKTPPPNYNTSAYYLKMQFAPAVSLDFGVVGSMLDKKGRFWGVQDNIHLLFKNSLHPNNDNTRWYLGGSFNQSLPVRLD